MLSIKVAKFGPIIKGKVVLRPLTIFVGPNNAGKSYLSLLLYSIFRSFSSLIPLARLLWLDRYVFEVIREMSPTEKKDIQIWIQEIFNEQKSKLLFSDLPKSIQEKIRNIVMKFSTEDAPQNLATEIQRCFASEITELVKKEAHRGLFSLTLEQADPTFHLMLKLKNNSLSAESCDCSGLQEHIEIDLEMLRREASPPETAMLPLSSQVIAQLLRHIIITPYYFPAARSGILQSHKALAGAVVSRSPLVGIEPLEIPRLSGVVADFISILLRLERQRRHRGKSAVAEIARFLESEVSHGKIDLKVTETRFEYPEIYYESGGKQFPLHRTSSMVSEIAPIVLFLKYVVHQGDLLFIEEPEAHLHPDSQRTLARAIVKLIRNGVHILITTHSDYFVEQLNNFILLENAPQARLKLGYSEEDYLSPHEVGAYLFEFNKQATGSYIRELEVSSEYGILQDEFTRIAEALYQESVKLYRLKSKR